MTHKWDDIASALESTLECVDMPIGLRPMLMQAIAELRASRDIVEAVMRFKAGAELTASGLRQAVEHYPTASDQCPGCLRKAEGKPYSWDYPHNCADIQTWETRHSGRG